MIVGFGLKRKFFLSWFGYIELLGVLIWVNVLIVILFCLMIVVDLCFGCLVNLFV